MFQSLLASAPISLRNWLHLVQCVIIYVKKCLRLRRSFQFFMRLLWVRGCACERILWAGFVNAARGHAAFHHGGNDLKLQGYLCCSKQKQTWTKTDKKKTTVSLSVTDCCPKKGLYSSQCVYQVIGTPRLSAGHPLLIWGGGDGAASRTLKMCVRAGLGIVQQSAHRVKSIHPLRCIRRRRIRTKTKHIYIYICSNSRVQNSRLYGRKNNLEFHAVQGGSEFQAVWSKKGVQNSKPSRFRIPGWSKSGVQNFKLQNPLKYWIVLYELLNPLK